MSEMTIFQWKLIYRNKARFGPWETACWPHIYIFFLSLFLTLIWNELFQFLYFVTWKYVISIFFLYWFGRYISCLPTVSNIWVFSFLMYIWTYTINDCGKLLECIYRMISGNRGKLMQSLFPLSFLSRNF